MKPLEPSSSAAAALGPKALTPSAVSLSTSPSTSGPSGPTTTKSMALSWTKRTSASTSSDPMGTSVATSAMPALPGAQ